MKPDHNLGVQMKITRRSLKQSGAALEAAIRRDMQGAMGAAMDQAVFSGHRGQWPAFGRDHRAGHLWHCAARG